MAARYAWRAAMAGLSGLGLAVWGGGAFGATPPPVQAPPSPLSREQVNPAGQVESTRRQRPPDVFSGPAIEACQLSDDPALAFEFHQGVIDDDAKILSEHDRQTAWGGALGRKITPRELCEIRDRLAARIFRKGVLARVIIPPQTISGGVVTFRVIAAKIVSVRFEGEAIGPAQAKVEAYLNHLRQRNAFDLDSAQRWLLLVNDIPGVQAAAKIVHSTAPGAPPEGLDLVVVVKLTPVDELGEVANTNAATLGPWSGIVRADLNSFTSLGERTSLIAYSTLGNNRQEVVQLIETAKVGDSGLYGQATFSWGHSRPGDVLAPLDLTGNSFVGSFELDYPLIRLQRRTLVLAAGMDLINQDTDQPGGQALSSDALRVAWFRTDASASALDRPLMNTVVTTQADVSFQVRKGLDVLGASRPTNPVASRLGGSADAWVLRGEGHALMRITPRNSNAPPITLSTHFIGQWADRPLLAYEEQGIGNLSVGRGYDPNAASGDRVVADELKLEIGPMKLWRALRVTPYAFGDIARVGYLSADLPDVTLRSAGAGLQFRFPYDSRGDAIRIDLAYAKPFDRPFPSQAKPPERWLVQFIITH